MHIIYIYHQHFFNMSLSVWKFPECFALNDRNVLREDNSILSNLNYFLKKCILALLKKNETRIGFLFFWIFIPIFFFSKDAWGDAYFPKTYLSISLCIARGIPLNTIYCSGSNVLTSFPFYVRFLSVTARYYVRTTCDNCIKSIQQKRMTLRYTAHDNCLKPYTDRHAQYVHLA